MFANNMFLPSHLLWKSVLLSDEVFTCVYTLNLLHCALHYFVPESQNTNSIAQLQFKVLGTPVNCLAAIFEIF